MKYKAKHELEMTMDEAFRLLETVMNDEADSIQRFTWINFPKEKLVEAIVTKYPLTSMLIHDEFIRFMNK